MQDKTLNELDVKLTRNEKGWQVSFEPHKSFSYYKYSFLIKLIRTFIRFEIKITKMYRHLKRTKWFS
jgi:glutamine amidotransferase PdxT